MFGWFKKKKQKPLDPEGKWIIVIEDSSIQINDPKGETKTLLKSSLTGVMIETNDSGPWGLDVWWSLFGSDDKPVCAFPQGATGEDEILDYLTALPSFDHQQMINAMSSTGNAVFPVWRRPSETNH
ncbi:hypothetical protein [Parasphingorhabdus sp.]|uniref:hypothetical protein n=1 Tax=Parasphingorhabdus sp. TaxID=2709688 RepID=UPI003D28B613